LLARRPEITGADGVVEGATGPEGVEAAEAPAALLATTVTMYDVPFTSAVIWQLVARGPGATQEPAVAT
jgi:hypothetical protein